ncbi:MAG: oligosaccharide flippase family protein [Candidatus Gastranaerophilales bacterium]|nr:oligosaccharide flippase family protein [Candidatus Gastranaerophilales bacterium]
MQKAEVINNSSKDEVISREVTATSLKNMFVDMVKYSPSKICGLIGNTIVIPIYTTLLSTEQYGIYTLAISFLSFLCIIFSDWIGLSALRFFRHHEITDKMPKYLTTVLALLGMNLLIMFLLAPLYTSTGWFYKFFSIPPKIIFSVLILVIPVAIRALFFQILRAQIKPNAFTISTILNQILTIGISIIFMKYVHTGAYSVLIAMGISILLIDFVLLYQSNITKYFKYMVKTKPKFEIFTSLFRYGVPLSITSISLWAINQSNRFIMMHESGFKDVGLVGVSYNLTFSILMTFFVIITLAAVPRIINLYEDGIDVRPIISKLTEYYILISLPIIVLYSVYSKDIILLLANEKFIGAYVLIPFLAFSVFFLSLADYTTLQYSLSKKTYLNTIIRVISAIVGLGLNIILISKYGLLGLGVATLCGNILYFLLSIIVVVPNLEWQIPYKKISQILVCFIPAALIYYFVFNKLELIPLLEIISLLLIYYGTYISSQKFHKFIKNM